MFSLIHTSKNNNDLTVEVYPRPDGTIYICGIGGSDYITTDELKKGAFRGASCQPNEVRVEAAKASFQEMSTVYKEMGELDRTQACMRPCPPDAMPYMGSVPGYEGAFINAGHNCWYVALVLISNTVICI
jgi:glycine/D-amino acid oxidase-like deaminating enzyme